MLDALMTLPLLLQAGVSPDGRWVAWTWFRVGPGADAFVAPTDGSAAPTRLTETPEKTFITAWTHDSRAVIVEQDHDGNERTQFFRVDLERPGVMLPLTEPDPPYFPRGGRLHPNGRWFVYGANYDFAAGREIEQTWVYRRDLETGERLVLARPVKNAWNIPVLNDQGTHVLYGRKDLDPAGYQLWMTDVEGREDREIVNVGARAKASGSWFPDGRRVLVTAEAGTYNRLGVWDRADGSLRWLIDDPARQIEGAYAPRRSAQVVVIEQREARVYASLLDVATGVETPLPRVPGNLVPLAPCGDGRWVGQYYSARQPTDLVLFDPRDPQPEAFASLTRVWERTALRADNLCAPEDFRWRSVDGLEIQGWLYRARAPRGTVVYIHGGPTVHSQDALNAQIQYFVACGFNVLDPNYRGSTGFGLTFRESIKVDGWGGREQADIVAGIEALIASGIAERGRVGVTGTSYGGYSSWFLITHQPPEIVAASAPVCGMTDLVVDYETTRPDLRPYSEEMLGGRPDQAPERYFERSPINFVDRIHGRLLIVQGLQDPNVTPENVRQVTAALQRAGVEYGLLAFEDEGHGILRPENQRKLNRQLSEFFGAAFGA
jgi:dipeptidyl aminopeptidase/acylaminoacyl peptidase